MSCSDYIYLYTCVVTNFNIFNKLASGDHDASAFVATNQRQFNIEWPITIYSMEIPSDQWLAQRRLWIKTCYLRMTYSREFNINKNLIWAWLPDRNLLILDLYEG